jgi:hypothetical protein
MRQDGKFWLIALLLCVWPIAASADDGEGAKLISECSAADLPQASVDSCLERARVLEETEPSSQLQTLEASLEQRESGRRVRTPTAATAAPPEAEVAPEPNMAAPDEGERDVSTRSAEPDISPPRSGSALEDEPPVSDTPDVPSSTDRPTDEDSNDPPQT